MACVWVECFRIEIDFYHSECPRFAAEFRFFFFVTCPSFTSLIQLNWDEVSQPSTQRSVCHQLHLVLWMGAFVVKWSVSGLNCFTDKNINLNPNAWCLLHHADLSKPSLAIQCPLTLWMMTFDLYLYGYSTRLSFYMWLCFLHDWLKWWLKYLCSIMECSPLHWTRVYFVFNSFMCSIHFFICMNY